MVVDSSEKIKENENGVQIIRNGMSVGKEKLKVNEMMTQPCLIPNRGF